MQENAAASSAELHLHRGATLKIPKKPPLSRPPKSPKRCSFLSSSNATSPTQDPPQSPLYSSYSAASSHASSSTSPIETESYFDALSLQPASPLTQPSLAILTQQSPSADRRSLYRPSFERRESLASSGCLSDEELATRAYAQRQTDRRTSLLPLPSPDAPHSQRRRHRRRPPSSASGLSSSQTSISSAAGSLHASETDEPTRSPTRERDQDLPGKWWHAELDSQQVSRSPELPASTQVRSTAQHPHVPRDSQTSASISNFSRISQATSSGPFDLDDRPSTGDLQSKQRQLQRDFYDSITRPTSSRSDTSSRLSMPVTPISLTTSDAHHSPPLPSLRGRMPDSQASFIDSHKSLPAYLGIDNFQDWAIPVIRNPPLGTSTSSRRSFSTSPASDSAINARATESSSLSASAKDDHRLALPTSRRTSASTTTRKRVGRIYSTSTVRSDGNDDELRTPRVSISNQGRWADSIYSVADTAPDTFPYMADTSKDLPAPPIEHAHASLGLGFDQYAFTEENGQGEDVFKQPGGSRFSMYTNSNASSANSPIDGDQGFVPSAPYSNTFRNSVNSFASSLASEPPTASVDLTEEEKKRKKRARILQELVQTEEDFSHDMALVRDVWLARARGKEMGEIMAILETHAIVTSRPTSTSSSNLDLHRPIATPDIRLVERKASAPQMQRNSSQNSFRSLKGLVNNLGKPNQERTGPDSGPRAASYGGAPRQRSLSNVQPLPPGAALYAPLRQVDTEMIFGNIEAVASFSGQFAAILREEQSAGDSSPGGAGIGQAFLTMLPRLSTVFSTYCAHFGDAMQRWESVADSLASYSRDCKDLCYGHTNAWDLPSLLIKPVQRCLKYPLFLQSLLECTHDAHPDKPTLEASNTAMLKVAESINEMKRRHEIVTKLIKRKARPGLYGSTRRGSEKSVPPASKTPSGGSFSASLSRKFKRSSRIGLPDMSTPSAVPEPDEEFETLLAHLETKHRLIQSFVLDSKSWSKSVRTAMVSLLQLSLAWKGVSSLLGQDESPEASQSSRTIDHFAVGLVRSAIEDQWRDMDQEIRKVLVPKATQLLELFSGPRGAIATRYHRYSESRSKAAAKDYALLSEHATAYHALNAQLKEELPIFLKGVDRIFIAVVQRLVTLQVAFNERMAEAWQDYIQTCCTQLGSAGQSANDSVAQWWQAHSALAQQLDSLKILAADNVIEDLERRQRNSLPPGLQPRPSSGRSSLPSSRQSDLGFLRRSGRQQSEDGPVLLRQARATPVLSTVGQGSQGSADTANRSSTFSSASAGSLSFSGQSASSVTSPPTPSPGYPVLWQGAVATSFRPSGQDKAVKGYNFLSCEPGDLFEVLDEVSGEKYLLVKPEGVYGDVGWLPAHLLHRLD